MFALSIDRKRFGRRKLNRFSAIRYFESCLLDDLLLAHAAELIWQLPRSSAMFGNRLVLMKWVIKRHTRKTASVKTLETP